MVITLQSALLCTSVASSSDGWIIWNANIRKIKADSYPFLARFDCFISFQRDGGIYKEEQLDAGICVYKEGGEESIFTQTNYALFREGERFMSANMNMHMFFPERGNYDIVFRTGTEEDISSIRYGVILE